MRFIFVFLFSFCLSFTAVLPLNEAFKVESKNYDKSVEINIKLGKEIYLYAERIKFFINEKELSTLINLPPSIQRDKEKVYYESLDLALSASFLQKFSTKEKNLVKLEFQGCSEQGLCYNPQILYFDLVKKDDKFAISSPYKNTKKTSQKEQSQENLIANFIKTNNFFLTLLSFFGYGLLLSLTPCILPMIPILSSLIVSKSGLKISKKHSFFLSFIYVFFMSLAYALAGILASFLGASIQGLLQKPSVLIVFALIFVLFALAMFGAFNLEMPLKIQNFIHKKSSKGRGVLSIAIMGFLSALIVGPCIAAPLAGALIYIANTKDIILGGLALFVMSFGMGIPLLFVGLSLSFLKPGAWMQDVKIFFGFVMLAMALWVLSRTISENLTLMFFGILGVFFCVFMGLFNKAFSILAKLKKGILILILAYSLTIFLGGLFGAKSFLNPLNLSSNKENFTLKYDYINKLVLLKDEIQNQNKPLMLDFTASWCENCKLLDELTFKDERIALRLQNYKLIKVDISENSDEDLKIMKEFGVFGPPVLIFYENSSEKFRITGFISADDLLEKL